MKKIGGATRKLWPDVKPVLRNLREIYEVFEGSGNP
jgi:hypothetical protein